MPIRWKKAFMERSGSFNLILLGDPASGKGTQAAHLIRKFGFYDFDMGREVRKPTARSHYDYKKTTAIGKLTPTAVVRGILARVVPSVPKTKGILFNGHPKMINEAKLVARLLEKTNRRDPLVLYLAIPMRETIQRARGRLRDDDSLRAIRNRRRYYETQIARVCAFFKKRYPMERINGVGSEAEVWKRIEKAIDRHMQRHGNHQKRKTN